jgi:hypothetical protein
MTKAWQWIWICKTWYIYIYNKPTIALLW